MIVSVAEIYKKKLVSTSNQLYLMIVSDTFQDQQPFSAYY